MELLCSWAIGVERYRIVFFIDCLQIIPMLLRLLCFEVSLWIYEYAHITHNTKKEDYRDTCV